MKAIDDLIEREGGYVNHKNDKGGPTKYGITQKTAYDHGYNGNMIDFPREMAERIYVEQFYLGTGISKITHPAVAEELLDSAVLHGPSTAIKWLQTALNVLNDAPPLVVDGVLGYATRSAAHSFLSHNQKRGGAVVLVRALNCLQGAYMLSLGDYGKPFIFGWLSKRVAL